jgi:hypothetical protein
MGEYTMNATAALIPFAGSMLGGYRHVCAFFSSAQEEYDTLLPFVRDGLERGERAYHVLPSQYREEHLEQLRSAGIDVATAQRRRQLEVATPQETYLRGGRFNKDAMLTLIQEALQTGATLGFPLTRLIAHAETVLWHPEDWSSVNEWIEYETQLKTCRATTIRDSRATPTSSTAASRSICAHTGFLAIIGGLSSCENLVLRCA